jgi:hypothetical protein
VNGHSSPGQRLQATDAWLPRGERHSPPACCTWFVSAHRSQTLNINSEIERTLHEVQISDNDVCEGRLRTVLACISGCILLAPASPANGGQEVFRPISHQPTRNAIWSGIIGRRSTNRQPLVPGAGRYGEQVRTDCIAPHSVDAHLRRQARDRRCRRRCVHGRSSS